MGATKHVWELECLAEYDSGECLGKMMFDIEPYVPAYISGPPENCYPEEGGYAEPGPGECSICKREADDKDNERAYDEWVSKEMEGPDEPDLDRCRFE